MQAASASTPAQFRANRARLLTEVPAFCRCSKSGAGTVRHRGWWGRAFHSATALPGGEVLIYGGVETSVVAGISDSMGVIDTVEMYDPAKATFQTVSVAGKGPIARAFHQVAVLSATDTQVKLMVFGGVTAPRGRQVLTTPFNNAPLRLAPVRRSGASGTRASDAQV